LVSEAIFDTITEQRLSAIDQKHHSFY
jgi:hypothetical protein